MKTHNVLIIIVLVKCVATFYVKKKKKLRFYFITLRHFPGLEKQAQTGSSKTKGKLVPQLGLIKIKWTITWLSGHSLTGKRV